MQVDAAAMWCCTLYVNIITKVMTPQRVVTPGVAKVLKVMGQHLNIIITQAGAISVLHQIYSMVAMRADCSYID